MHSPLQIGITGGIGSGKSLVCRIFQAFGVPVYAADDRAKWLTQHDPILKADIIRLLGPEAYDVQGNYNRPFVASQVFHNPERLQQLNNLIHPRVYADTLNWVQQQQHPYVIKEAALMKAAGDHNTLDKVIVVHAPESVRIDRIRLRDPHRSEAEIQSIISRQISDEERFRIADYIIYNDEAQLLLPQLAALHQTLLESARP